MNNFENFYNRIRDAKNAYDAARTEDEKNAARSAYKAVWDELKELGNAACRLFNEYEVSRDSGNDYLDINDNISDEEVSVWDNEAAKLIEAMRQNGIERFTFSSGWSHAVETAWLFKEAGCTIEGLVEINSRYTGWNSDEHEKAHGYLFRVEG